MLTSTLLFRFLVDRSVQQQYILNRTIKKIQHKYLLSRCRRFISFKKKIFFSLNFSSVDLLKRFFSLFIHFFSCVVVVAECQFNQKIKPKNTHQKDVN